MHAPLHATDAGTHAWKLSSPKNVHYLQFETVDRVETVENVDKMSTLSTRDKVDV